MNAGVLVGEELAVQFQVGIGWQVIGVQLLSKSDPVEGSDWAVVAGFCGLLAVPIWRWFVRFFFSFKLVIVCFLLG